MQKRIYYHDTDSGGVVYYANYLKYMEEARTDFFEARGIFIKEISRGGILFVVARQEIDYKFPAFYGDTLSITAKLEKISTVKLEFLHEATNQDNRLICSGKTIMVCVDKDIRPKPIPEQIKKSLSL